MTPQTLADDTSTQQIDPFLGIGALRISLGVLYLAHGLLKVFVFTFAGTAAFFASLGLPGWLAYAVIAVEVVGGSLLIAGVYTRWAALALLPVAAGAVWAHAGNGWLFSNTNGGWEFPLFLLVVTAIQILLGSGRFALAGPRAE